MTHLKQLAASQNMFPEITAPEKRILYSPVKFGKLFCLGSSPDTLTITDISEKSHSKHNLFGSVLHKVF